jgi:predicted metal-dependent peptidase
MGKGRKPPNLDPAAAAFEAARKIIGENPIFGGLLRRTTVVRRDGNACPPDGWIVISSSGQIHVHPTRRCEVVEWVYLLAHCLLHLGLGHFDSGRKDKEWVYACDVAVARFLADVKIGRPPQELRGKLPPGGAGEEALYREFMRDGVPEDLQSWGTAGPHYLDMIMGELKLDRYDQPENWRKVFGEGLVQAVDNAVRRAGNVEVTERPHSAAQRARQWFINSYPLLGSLAAGFKLIEEPAMCQRLSISVAAVDPEARELFINPAAGMTDVELRFVMAHELLHVGLRHGARRQGRDPYLWNVACDYVINGWLIEMGLGVLPKFGGLYDPELKGISAEGIYDRVVTDLRRYRKLATLRGVAMSDILERRAEGWWESMDGMDLDAFYRQCLAQGLTYHNEQGRGLLPVGLVQEIVALAQPPMAWDVQLARWFDGYFSPLEKRRSYARASRRQSSTPTIPRPRWVNSADAEDGRTFGVVLDTSGSMSRDVLGKALGAIASYAMSREVPWVRVVFCDAVAYDAGYLPPEGIAQSVRVKGRGGTKLQPGIDLLEVAEDFPKEGPVLVITDGRCDRLRIRREHGFLMPQGCHLPFVPVGEVFRMK